MLTRAVARRASDFSRNHRILAAAGLLLSASCADSEPVALWSGAVDTLATGTVRVTNPATGLWEAGSQAEWTLVQELTIGELQADAPYVFSSISGLGVDEQGRILAIDRQTNELRFYDKTGSHLKTVGGTGDGPGEYTAANGLVRLPSDSLLVIDQEGNRYSVLGPDGSFARTVQRQLPFYGWAFEGGIDDGRIYEVSRVGRDDDAEPAIMGTALRGGEASLDTILLPALREPPLDLEAFKVETESFGSYLGVPFAPSHPYFLDGEGGVWFGRGDRFRLLHVTFGGDTLREILLEAEPTPVTDEELDAWLAEDFVQEFRKRGGEIDVERIPTVKPYFDEIAGDPAGNLWVSTPTAPDAIEFAVFDTVGRYLGRVGFEGAERVPWVPPVVANGRLYMATRDDLEVNRIAVFRIETGAEELATPGS